MNTMDSNFTEKKLHNQIFNSLQNINHILPEMTPQNIYPRYETTNLFDVFAIKHGEHTLLYSFELGVFSFKGKYYSFEDAKQVLSEPFPVFFEALSKNKKAGLIYEPIAKTFLKSFHQNPEITDLKTIISKERLLQSYADLFARNQVEKAYDFFSDIKDGAICLTEAEKQQKLPIGISHLFQYREFEIMTPAVQQNMLRNLYIFLVKSADDKFSAEFVRIYSVLQEHNFFRSGAE